MDDHNDESYWDDDYFDRHRDDYCSGNGHSCGGGYSSKNKTTCSNTNGQSASGSPSVGMLIAMLVLFLYLISNLCN